MNRANRVLGVTNLSKGGTVGTICDVRMIFQYAIKSNSVGFILAHNHPGGNPKPSEADKMITEKIKSADHIMDIRLLYHIILTPYDGYFSFVDNGILPYDKTN